MWLLEQCRKEWQRNGKEYSYGDIIAMAREATPFRSLVDPNDALFANPKSMQEAIADYCRRTAQPAPGNDAQTVRAIFDSLALCYRDTLESMRRVSPHDIKRLHIIGGGSKNTFMSQLTANATGVPVVAGPSEATAIGNCMVQARAAGLAGDRWEMRALIARAVETETFAPCDREAWESAYTRYKSITTGKKQE
jgi:rhamnulokinase